MKPDEIKAWIDRCSRLAAAGNWDAYLDAIGEASPEDHQRWYRTNKARLDAVQAPEVPNALHLGS